ncbi:hypothetical protein H4R18_005332 [Coemansia javaensis]|uniref:Uncharacterized protein n=1 Tax=Coemansia javaensis TaxID=2761396 RepID=A0A9W8H2W3_9FUNG|nr:hypothetical protein H4R18_005332 [Coemansia javaensis]
MLLSSYLLPQQPRASGDPPWSYKRLIARCLPWFSSYSSEHVASNTHFLGSIVYKGKARAHFKCEEFTIYAIDSKLLIFKVDHYQPHRKAYVYTRPVVVRAMPTADGGFDLRVFHKDKPL